MFRIFFKYVVLTGISALLAGCASNPTIDTDYDHTVDFSRYRTYGFFNPMSIESPDYSTIDGSVFRDAISKEMEYRGYKPSDNPDLMINVSGQQHDRKSVISNVHLVESARKRMVWKGVLVGPGKQKSTQLDEREVIYAGIRKLFAAYPFRAGQ